MVQFAFWSAHARVKDRKALKKLLAPLPADIANNVRFLATAAGREKAGMRYNAELKRAYLLQNSNDVILCVTFERIADAHTAARLYEELVRAAGQWSLEDHAKLAAIYSSVTGVACEAIAHGGQA